MNDTRAVSGASQWLFVRLLGLYPASFRRRFGADMTAVFEDRYREARRRGRSGPWLLWVRTLPDMFVAMMAARRRRRRLMMLPRAAAGGGAPAPSRSPASKGHPMERLLQDLRFAVRILSKNPGFTVAASLTLAIGIGLNTAVFGLVDALLYRPMPLVQEPDRLVAMFTGQGSGSLGVSSYMDYKDFRDRGTALAGLAAYKPRLMDMSLDGATERVAGMMVTGNYFDVLGVSPARGRLLGPDDDRAVDAHPVAVISAGLWKRRYAEDPRAVGSIMRLNGREFTVLGVLPDGFRGTSLASSPDVYAPMMMQPHFMPTSGNLLDRRGWGGILVFGRLADEATIAQARAEVQSTGAWITSTFPDAGGRTYGLTSFQEGTLMPGQRGPVRQMGMVLLGIVSLVLLVACVNVANLLLARCSARQREINLRQALGAGRGRLIRQLLIESLVLALLGGGAGLLVAALANRLFLLLPLPLSFDLGVDGRVLMFTALVSLVTALVFGLVPALRVTRAGVGGWQGAASDRVAPRRGFALGKLLVIAQVTTSVSLLVIAGLFGRTLANLERVDLGFDARQVAVIGIDPVLQGYRGEEIAQLFREVIERVERLPGIDAVSYANALPGPDNDNVTTFNIAGYEVPDGRPPRSFFSVVGPGYFATMGIPIRQGRGFGLQDDAAGAAVLVINETAARYLEETTGAPALGALLGSSGPEGPFSEVIGVVADSTTGPMRAGARPTTYVPQLQTRGSWSRMMLLLRTRGDETAILEPVRDAIAEIDADMPTFEAGTLTAHLSSTLGQERLTAVLIAVSAGLALVLAVVGLYGVLAYAVSQRTAELGVRMALGARDADVVRMVIRQGLSLVAIGLLVGAGAALAAGRLVGGFLYGVSGADPGVYLAVSAILLVVASVAAWQPARRATRVDPVVALRDQ